jgi:hypothetical protein
MKKLNQDPLDQFFRESLESPDLSYKEEDWLGLETLLEKSRNRRLPAWRVLGGIAAGLLIFLSIWLFKPDPTSEDQNFNAKSDKTKIDGQVKTIKPISPAESGKSKELTLAEISKKNIFIVNKVFDPVLTAGLPSESHATNKPDFTDVEYGITLSANNNGRLNTDPLKMISVDEVYPAVAIGVTRDPVQKKSTNNYRRTSLSFAVSPDLNSAEQFNKSSFGGSFGIGAGYRVNKLLTLSTGVYYSKKTYSANPSNYKSSAAPFNYAQYAKSIDADCRVLDVPLSFNFNLLNKPKQSLFASVGLSSYFMLKEKYTFIRKTSGGYPNTGPEPSYTIDNKNNHIFSVLTVAAGISKPISNNADIVIQPYAKLPLTGIGQGKTNLQSVGVAFQLNFKFLKKPANSKAAVKTDF